MADTAVASGFQATELTDKVIFYFIEHGMQIITALVIMGIGFLVARWVGRYLLRWLETQDFDQPVRLLAVRIAKLLIIGFVGLMALGQMGVQVTPLIAGLGVAGVGVSLAMQGLLGNLTAGLTIIFTKPFTTGEYVELLGVYGEVTDIALFSTTLLHADRSRVIIPNRKIIGEILHNYGTVRQLDLSVGIAYTADLGDALSAIEEVLGKNTRVLKDPAPNFGISALDDSFVTIAIKPWVSVNDFIPAHAEIYRQVLENLQDRRISVAPELREVRLINQAA